MFAKTLSVFLLLILLSSTAVAATLGVATGRETGTYYRFGEDMSRVAALQKIDLRVYPSRGAIQNLVALYERRDLQLAITQADVLYFMVELGNEAQRRVVSATRIVLPLYAEEVHVVARPEIRNFSDLQGRRVAVGEEGSGTALTSQILFSLSGIEPGEMVSLEAKEAIQALLDRKLDAAILVVGVPMKLLQEAIPANADLHLIPMDDEVFRELYGGAVAIPGGTYPWQDNSVKTIGIMAALMTLDFPPDAEDCANVKTLSTAIIDNIEWLISKGHDKWSEVSFDFPVAELDRSGCSSLYQ